MRTLLKNGTLVNPRGVSGKMNVAIEDGVISAVGKCEGAFDKTIDCTGKTVMPGFIDMHVHLREPGFEYKEDIASGTNAAVHGGFTAVACMPNTAPVNDDVSVLAYIKEKAAQAGNCRVYPVCAITKGLKGAELTEMGLLMQNGAIGFSDDGKPVAQSNRMRLAMQYSRGFDALIMSHCEDTSLADEGVMNEGQYSVMLGLAGICGAAESSMVARDLLLAKQYRARLHICHVSAEESVELIRAAKGKGVSVTCETAPHYFSADESWVESYDTNTKMNPPLRAAKDVKAIKEGLADGTIDAIATDHAPHCLDEKRTEYNIALNGIIGLQTSFSLGITNLVNTGVLTLEQLVEKMSCRPAEILRVKGGVIKKGEPADITVADTSAHIVYTPEMMVSKSKNSPFFNRDLFGVIEYTIVGGQVKYERY